MTATLQVRRPNTAGQPQQTDRVVISNRQWSHTVMTTKTVAEVRAILQAARPWERLAGAPLRAELTRLLAEGSR